MRKVFIILAISGVIVISILSFTLPNEPFEIIPSYNLLMGFDKPLWLVNIVGGSFFYLLGLYCIYNLIDSLIQKKSSKLNYYSSSKSSNNNLM